MNRPPKQHYYPGSTPLTIAIQTLKLYIDNNEVTDYLMFSSLFFILFHLTSICREKQSKTDANVYTHTLISIKNSLLHVHAHSSVCIRGL